MEVGRRIAENGDSNPLRNLYVIHADILVKSKARL